MTENEWELTLIYMKNMPFAGIVVAPAAETFSFQIPIEIDWVSHVSLRTTFRGSHLKFVEVFVLLTT